MRHTERVKQSMESSYADVCSLYALHMEIYMLNPVFNKAVKKTFLCILQLSTYDLPMKMATLRLLVKT